jgi:hypothetical protein
MADDWFTAQGAPGGMQYAGASPTFNEQGGGYQAPAAAAGAPAGGAGPTAPAGGNPTDRAYVQSQLANWYASKGLTPTGPGTGPTDIAYYTDKILETGGWTNQTGKGEDNINYWTSRIPQDIAEAKGGGAPGAAGMTGSFGGMGGPRPYGTSAAPEATPFSYGRFELPSLNETTDPGYGARLQTGVDAIQRSAAAKGTLLTGGTLKGLNRFAQDYASNEYGNVYNRALQGYNTNYNTAYQPWQSNFNNAYQSWQGNLGAQQQGYSQLYGLSNLGLNAAGQQAGLGTTYAGQAGNLLGSQATNAGNLITGAGNAASAGTIGQANAFNQGLAGASNAAQMYYLSRLLTPSAPSTSPGPGQPGYGVLR